MSRQTKDKATTGSTVNVDDDAPLSARPDEQDDAGDSLRLAATIADDGTLSNVIESVGPQPAGEDGTVIKNFRTRGGRHRIEVTGPDHDRVRARYAEALRAAGAIEGDNR